MLERVRKKHAERPGNPLAVPLTAISPKPRRSSSFVAVNSISTNQAVIHMDHSSRDLRRRFTYQSSIALSVAFGDKLDCSNLDSEDRHLLKIEKTVAYHLCQKFLFRDT